MSIHIHHVQPLRSNPLQGVSTPVKAATTEEVMRQSNLYWRVDEHNLVTESGLVIPDHKALTRSDDSYVLGVVGKGFEVLQNAEAFAFCDSLVARGKVEYVSAGQLNGGKRIFIQCKIIGDNGPAEIAKGDPVEPYFLLANGHDGSLAVRSQTTPIRVICQNTFMMAISKKKNETDCAVIKHTGNMQDRLQQSLTMFGWVEKNFNTFVAMAKETATKKITTEAKLRKFFRDVFQVEEVKILDEESNTRLKNRENRLAELFMEGAGQKNTAIRGTAWAALNAVTEYLDHEAVTKTAGGAKKEDDTRTEEENDVLKAEKEVQKRMKRFESNTFGNNANIKRRAFELALAV
jgi:phage/plasmid-like protein (TIGR03299 family)